MSRRCIYCGQAFVSGTWFPGGTAGICRECWQRFEAVIEGEPGTKTEEGETCGQSWKGAPEAVGLNRE